MFILFLRLAILRYLSQKYTNFAGWGKAPEDRYRVHSVLDWASSKLLKYKNRSFLTSKKPHLSQLANFCSNIRFKQR